jgi:glycosyltransferase involved in cell wall biosynthesis
MKKTRILFEGHDLKFLTHVMNHYKLNHQYHVDVFTYEGHIIKDVREILRILPDIDIIFSEWGLGNLQWFSHHKLPGQKLVTRIHSQEFSTTYLSETNWENVDKVIVVGPYMKERFDRLFPGVSDKCQVIFNMVNTDAFHLEKMSDSRFHLGLLGILPKLKAPHLAVEILQELKKHDNRYKLCIKSRRPEDVAWLWRKPEEQVYYQSFYESIEKEGLSDSVILEPHGNDVAEWFSKIGFIISPSEYESFHMAIAEGMASRAIPVIRNWKGSEDLFPLKYSFSTVKEAAAIVLKYTEEERFLAEGQVTRGFCIEHFDLNILLPEYDKILLAEFHPAAVRRAYAVMADNHRQLVADLEMNRKEHEKLSGDLSSAIAQQKILTESNAGLTKELTVFGTEINRGIVSINSGLTQGFSSVNGGLSQGFSAINSELTQGFSSVNSELLNKFSDLDADVKQQMSDFQQHADFLRLHEKMMEQRFKTFLQQYDSLQKQFEELSGIKDQYIRQIDAFQKQIAENKQLDEKYQDLIIQFDAFRIVHQEKLEVLKGLREEHVLLVDKLARTESQLSSTRQELGRVSNELTRENQRIMQIAEEEKLHILDRHASEKKKLEEQFLRENNQLQAIMEADMARMEREINSMRNEHAREQVRKDSERIRLQERFNQLKDTNADLERRLLLAFNSITWKTGAILVKKPMDFLLWIGRKLSLTK